MKLHSVTEWEAFVKWQSQDYIIFHGLLEKGQFLDKDRFERHKDCYCRGGHKFEQE